ncbi:hypothetical protein A1F96_06919 [Pyrenophora tritici-repentis]|nr:hypothetical protein A1F96_06919 [Pyrenophora tritici-repentis]
MAAIPVATLTVPPVPSTSGAPPSTFTVNSISGNSDFVVLVAATPSVSTNVPPGSWQTISGKVAEASEITPAATVYWDREKGQISWGITRIVSGSTLTDNNVVTFTPLTPSPVSSSPSTSVLQSSSSNISSKPESFILQTTSSASSGISLPSRYPSPQKDSLSTGAIAGIAVGCLVAGALVAGIVLLFCWRRRRVPEARYSKTNTYAVGSQEKGFAAQTIPLAGREHADAPTNALPQPLEDKAISGEISKISNAIKNHVQSYYHINRISPNLIDHNDLHTLGSDLPISVGTLATLISNATTREVALRFIIAWVIVSKLQSAKDPAKSLLPTEIAPCLQMIDSGNRDQRAPYLKLARWRIFTAELLQSSYVRNPFTVSDSRHEVIQATLVVLDNILQSYADPRINNGERKRNLEELLKRSALFAFTLFSQPGAWEFEWQGHSVTSGELCIFPTLVQVVDENGQPRKHVRPKQERTESEARSSITAQDETRTEAPTDFPAISTAYSFADHVLYSEKSSPDLLTFANIIRLVRIDTEEANRLYLSSVVSNFLDSFPTKRIWIEGSLQEVQRALNDIGKDMDVAWGQEGDPSTVSFKRKIDWGLKNQKKLLKKQQQLSVCHSQLTGAIYVMQTAELCGKPGTIAQDPIFEAPARPWVPHNEMNAQRGPYSRHKYRTSQANLSALNIKLSSEAQWNDAETASVNSLPVELAGSTPDDLNLTGRHNSQDFLSPQVSRELVSESPSLLRRPRARSDYFPSTANRERLSGASIDVIPSSTTVDDTTLERSDSTLSAQATVSTPMLARRYRATSVHIQRPTEKHRSLPSKLPHLKSQPSLIDDLVGYVVPNKEIVQIPDREWTASPSSSVPSISLTSSPIIGHTLSAVPEMTILNDESSAVTPISDVEGHTIQLSQAEDPSRDKGDHPTQLQDPNVATSPIETQDDFVSRRRSSDVPQRSTSSLSYYSLSTDTPRSPSSFTNFTLPDHEPVRRPSSQRPSQRMAKRRPHISSSRSLVSAPSLTIATIVEPTTTISNTEEGANQEATPSLAPETTTTINMNGFSQSIFVQTTNTSEELDDDDMVLSVLQERLRCQLQVKTMAENLVRAADAETPSSPTPAITESLALREPTAQPQRVGGAPKGVYRSMEYLQRELERIY